MTNPSELTAVLAQAQALGFVGPRHLADHLAHADGFGVAWEATEHAPAFTGRAVDLGSGGGLPGLVLAVRWPASRWTLVDANVRRTAFLDGAVAALALGDRCAVVRGRAEELGRVPEFRGQFDLVTARGFAAPSPTAECAAPFLRPGGVLLVSEPPAEDAAGARWDGVALASLELEDEGVLALDFRYRVLRQRDRCPDRFPRRVGLPEKRPLF